MFSRSEKTEEATDALAEPSSQRSPMVLAALAGLLAIAGAFLLVSYLGGSQDEVADDETAETASEAATTQVLLVTARIPAGTSAAELAETPGAYLSARLVPEDFVAGSAIRNVSDLQEIAALTLAADALPGEQLLRDRFIDKSDFTGPSFAQTSTIVKAPEGHHLVVLSLPSTRALGGLIRPGDNVTVVANLRVGSLTPRTFELSTVVLNSVEVIDVKAATEVAGQNAQQVDEVGIATRGTFVVTVAVEPDELTDLTFAMEYGVIHLAVAVEGATNEDFPRAATTVYQIAGDDGVWLTELEDGNLIDLVSLFGTTTGSEDGESIEVVLPGAIGDDETDEDEAEAASLANDEDDETEPQPGDS